MEKEIKQFEAEKIIYFESQQKLDKMYHLVVIDSAGEYIAYHPLDEEEKDMN